MDEIESLHNTLSSIINEIKQKIPKSSSRNEHYHPLVAPYAKFIETIYVKSSWFAKKKIATIIFKVDGKWINSIITGVKATDLPILVMHDKKYYDVLNRIAEQYRFKKILKCHR